MLDSIRENKARCVADRRCSLGRASAAVLHLRCGHALLQDVVVPTMHTAPRILRRDESVQVCLKGTLFTPLSKKNTSTQSLNVQMRKDLELTVNLVHGFSLPAVPVRHSDLDIVVIRCGRKTAVHVVVQSFAVHIHAWLACHHSCLCVHKATRQ